MQGAMTMARPWEEHEVYQLSHYSPLSDLHGVGNEGSQTLRVFHTAGFTKLGDLRDRNNQEDAVRAAARQLAELDDTVGTGNWRALATRCVTIIRRVRSAEAQPYVPEHFICPILYTCMEDPVCTPYGYSYERHAIERVANDPDPARRLDPLTRQPIEAEGLFPNRALKDAIDYHNSHLIRFSVPYKVR